MRETLLTPAARTTSGFLVVGTPVLTFGDYESIMFLLNVTAAATEAGDTLDVFIQKNVGPEDTPVWHDFIHFTQVLGNGGAKQHVAQVSTELITTSMGVVKDGALAVGCENGPISDRLRIKWNIVDVATLGNQSFNFAVYAQLS